MKVWIKLTGINSIWVSDVPFLYAHGSNCYAIDHERAQCAIIREKKSLDLYSSIIKHFSLEHDKPIEIEI